MIIGNVLPRRTGDNGHLIGEFESREVRHDDGGGLKAAVEFAGRWKDALRIQENVTSDAIMAFVAIRVPSGRGHMLNKPSFI